MRDDAELTPASGFLEPGLDAEFPGLRIDWLSVDGARRDSPPAVRARLATMSNRWRGASVVAMRTQPVPHAYRTFFHQIGLDPDTHRIPSEAAAVARLLHGEFRSRDLVADATLIGLLETGVPVWALDAESVDAGGLGIRTSVAGDRLGAGDGAHHLTPGSLLVADAARVHALLFEQVTREHEVGPRTRRIVLFAVGVPGVPVIHVEEALWVAGEVLGAR